MYSARDTPKGWVAPFGHPGIKACSQLPRAFRSVPRPSSPPGAKASTRCPSHAQTLSQHPPRKPQKAPAKPTMHRNHPRPKLTGRDAPPIPRQASTHHHSAHIFTPLNAAAKPAIGRVANDANRVRHPCQHSHGHTRTTPQPAPQRCKKPRPPEVSCAPRDAPEPDSQSAKNKPTPKTGAHRPRHQPPRFAGANSGRPDPIRPLNPTITQAGSSHSSP